MPGFKTKTIALVDTVFDYSIRRDETNLAPFFSAWPSKPFNTRIVSQSTLPVLSCLPELVINENPDTESVSKMFKKNSQ
ncbi:MAG: hypothetical protein HOK84_11375 [Bacteroidetes bacterium]|jgi:hypothetical protein|nr:hypothetical protein [Bacteroidota bacterium]